MTELDRRAVRWAAHQRARSECFRPMRVGVDELAKALTADDADALSADEPKPSHPPVICPTCGFIGPPVAVERHMRRRGHGGHPEPERTPNEQVAANPGYDAEMALTKAAPEKRYTFGPLYLPNTLDAHREFATADDLQEAAWNYFRGGNRELRKQHGSKVIGEVVEMVSWPLDHDADLIQADGSLRKRKLPAGTVYCGVRWTPEAWADVKAGRITGLSMGGSTVRVKGARLS